MLRYQLLQENMGGLGISIAPGNNKKENIKLNI